VQDTGDPATTVDVKILLAEDDNSLRDTIAEYLRNAGYTVIAVGNGLQAIEALSVEGGFNAAILDGLLPKMTGFDVAKQVRSQSPSTGVLLMSGVFKSISQQQDQLAQTGARGFLVKPFDLARLLDALRPIAPPPQPAAGRTGGANITVDQQPMPAEGSLLEMPPLYLGWRLQREVHTGVLELFGATSKARVFVYKGKAVFAQHSDPLLHVGVELLKAGVIDPDQFKQASDLAVSRSLGLYEVLKGENIASESQLRSAYKTLVPQIVEAVATWSGRFRFTNGDAFASVVPAASTALVDTLLSGAGKATDKDLEPHVEPRRPLRLAPGENWAEVVPMLSQYCGSDSLTRAINGRATIAQLLEVSPTPKERSARLRQVYVLMSTMSVQASLDPIPMARAVEAPRTATPAPVAPTAPQASTPRMSPNAAAPTAPAVDDARLQFTPQDVEARNRISAKAAEIAGKSLWDILGVKRGVDAATLKKAYFQLSRDFHPDAYAGLQLGSAQRQLDDVFTTIQDAYATLSDDNKRGEYEAKTNLELGGGSSDIGAIFQAESDFNRIKNLLERGEYTAAARMIGRVASIMANNEEVRGVKMFLDWWPTKNVTTGEAIIKELATLYKAAPGAHVLGEFQGRIHLELGNIQKARQAFKKVLEFEPKNVSADNGLRAANRKQEEAEKAANSGLGRFLKR
jgi:two-component system chemotaxis response regulator CheY